MSITEDSRPATPRAAPIVHSPTGPGSLGGQRRHGTQDVLAAEGQDSPQANRHPATMAVPPAGSETGRSQRSADTHRADAAADDFPGGHPLCDAHDLTAAGDQALPAAIQGATPIAASPLAVGPAVLAPWPEEPIRDLAAAADTLHDIERLRIASENRLRQFTRGAGEADKDGKQRGFGWDLRSPAVVAMATLVASMLCSSDVVEPILGKTPKKKGCCLEHDAERNLLRALRAHPLGPWVQEQRGIGPKQGARLIAVISDPYMRPAMLLPDGSWEAARRRTVSELWSYCGLRPGQKRKRGERANWSSAAKMRAWNVSVSMLKAGNREAYDKRKAATEGRLHAGECVRCGPSGKPAQPGTPWSDGHRHQDALRYVSKEVLKELWREGGRIHLENPQALLPARLGGSGVQSCPTLPSCLRRPGTVSARQNSAPKGGRTGTSQPRSALTRRKTRTTRAMPARRC